MIRSGNALKECVRMGTDLTLQPIHVKVRHLYKYKLLGRGVAWTSNAVLSMIKA